ncbi:ATP-binding protein [Streptomyces apocyni]|uniref:ATP-binding protein n=1 Tax=Streptomyces apocyni TaxID=2654677 RepID=UPI001E5014A5|nr:ATP-binding protein [Streptomyces apocyni]
MTAAQEGPDSSPGPDPGLDPGPVVREDCLDYTPTTRSVPLVRRRVARLVGEWGYPEVAGDAALLASELATNALLHGSLRGRLFRVRVVVVGSALRIEVSDPRGEREPEARTADGGEDTYGRGLWIVAQVASRWGCVSRVVGKTVFAELELKSPAVRA